MHADNQDASSSEDSAHPPALSNSALERLQLHMQLQRLNSPLSFHNNLQPLMWPKMHPLHEKMIKNLQPSSEIFNNHPDQQGQIDPININPHPENDLNVPSFYELPIGITDDSIIASLQHDSIKISDSVGNSPGPKEIGLSTEQMLYGNDNMQPAVISSLVHSDHQTGGILGDYCRTSGANSFISQENQNQQMMLDFDCFRGILEGSSSWNDSSSVDVHAGGIMFQDYGTGYNHL